MASSTPWSIGKRRFRKLETNDTGKPYAGKPHVRFDEGLETESETGASVDTTFRTGGNKKTSESLPDSLAGTDAKNTRQP